MSYEKFKFPDEQENETQVKAGAETPSEETDVEIELIDDVPEKDRTRRPLDKEVADPTDDEIETYSEKVQARIKELTHARHDERRLKDELQRQNQEMERLLQYMADENKKLKQSVNQGQEIVLHSANEAAEAQLAAARKQLRDAQEAFDTDAIIEAQEALTDAKMRLDRVKNFRPTPLQEEDERVQSYQQHQQAQPTVDERTLRWQAKNQWYGQPGFEEYTSYALGLHHKLVNAGIDPRTDTYFEQIDARLKQTFPELFGENRDEKPEPSSPAPSRKQPAAVVAPASRSTGQKKIQLTTRQMELARKYGLTPQQYAAEVAKLENKNG